MGCSCGYNIHIKTLIITHYFRFLRFNFLTLRSLLVQILQMLYSCLFLSPSSCNLYTCTSQPSSYQSGMSSFNICVKTKPSCSTTPWNITSTSATALCAPKLFTHISVTNVTKTSPWHHRLKATYLHLSSFSKHQIQTSYSCSKFWKNFYVHYYFFVL